MRILFVTAPFRSHLYVQVPLASALYTAGHDVRVAASPEMAANIAATGLTGVPIGPTVPLDTEMNAAAQDLAVLHLTPDRKKAHQRDYAEEDPAAELAASIAGIRRLFNPDGAIHDLVAFADRWRPDLVVWDPFVYSGSVAAATSGAASARLLFGSDGYGQLRTAIRGSTPGPLRDDPVRDWLAPILRGYGRDYDERTAVGDCTIFPMPSWVWRPEGVNHLTMRHVPYHGPSIVEPWLSEDLDRRRICVSLGLSHRDTAFGFELQAGVMFDAVADLDVEVVATLSAKQVAGLPRLPDNVRVVEFAPLNVLLPTCSAIVHSGGAGTFAAAVKHAVPQLIVPNTYFSEKWWGPLAMANGVEEQGAGIYAGDADQLTADGLRADLLRVLDDGSFAANARRLSAGTRSLPTPNEVVPLLQDLVLRHRER
ncbi:glycosyltransferase [Dactylosporangium siamense]|uniref:Glycosyl transferase n=1 Tax=Dactylosporangium siamense TaxID=685454 RepID=A0A919UCU4_9ACTN|nr:glycosyltransferase [Dactylosporangium siamense]GIG47186.1 glycosyl transferase [Dactylosporangium siamense]